MISGTEVYKRSHCQPTLSFTDYANIETAARNLLSLLSASVNQGQVEVRGQSQVQVQIQGQHPSQGPCQESRARQANVQQEMSKLEKVQCVCSVNSMWAV